MLYAAGLMIVCGENAIYCEDVESSTVSVSEHRRFSEKSKRKNVYFIRYGGGQTKL